MIDPMGTFSYEGGRLDSPIFFTYTPLSDSTYVHYDFLRRTSEDEQAADLADEPRGVYQPATSSETSLNLLYHKFWKRKHDLKQYFIPFEQYSREFADWFFTCGIDELTLDQLLDLNDIYPPIYAATTLSDAVFDFYAISAPPLSRDLQLSLANFLIGLQGGPDRLICCLCGRSHSRKGRLEGCINNHFEKKPYVCNGMCGDHGW
jgi:hypothetical protein